MTPERFDIYDDQQNWIGTELRSVVHAKGYWHRSFHCWIVRDDAHQRMVLFSVAVILRIPSRVVTTLQQRDISLRVSSLRRQVVNWRKNWAYMLHLNPCLTCSLPAAAARRGSRCTIYGPGIQLGIRPMSQPATRGLHPAGQ